MKSTIKKIFITYLVIICCIYTPTAQAAGWSFGGYNFGNRSLNIVKDGVKITTDTVDSAPITSKLAVRVIGGAVRVTSLLGAISLITGIAEDAIDYVMNPANNTITVKSKTGSYYFPNTGVYFQSAEAAAAEACTYAAQLRSNYVLKIMRVLLLLLIQHQILEIKIFI